MATMKERLTKYDLKPVDERTFSEFEIHLLTLSSTNTHFVKFKKNEELARKELVIPANWKLVHIDFTV